MIAQTRSDPCAATGSETGKQKPAVWRVCAVVCLGLMVWHPAAGEVIRTIPVPGRIEVENYDTNGPGVSYSDTTPGNSGNVYRSDNVDIEATTDSGGGYDVGWTDSGEWLNYTLDVQTTAIYQFAFRVASAKGPGNIKASMDGLPLCSVTTPLTGGWQTCRR